ncbi:LytTR family DNA-binding domain-containing protein [Algibacter sp. PT7-4]|uniref:LytTR family DNA-binding domain-containing protein n=1 Tax=Algibacter ulvanivorans TaxID=3400999 RepID=UPI003AABB9E1
MNLKIFLEQPFNYFDTRKNKWIYVLSATIFALVFLALFQPYGLSEEVASPINPLKNIVLFFVSVGLNTFIILTFSQFFARKWFGFSQVNVKKYMFWFFLEALGLTLLSFAFSFIIPDLGNDFEKELNLGFQIKIFFKVIIVLVFPFIGSIIYVLIKSLNFEINELEDQLKQFKSKFNPTKKTKILKLKDENNNIDFSLSLNDFLYAESSNQYILIHYIKENKIKKHIIRNRMKNFLNQVETFPIQQCHRSYAVNLLNVKHKSKKEGKSVLVMSFSDHIMVPISKPYLTKITDVFTN